MSRVPALARGFGALIRRRTSMCKHGPPTCYFCFTESFPEELAALDASVFGVSVAVLVV
jgi:hypothetical protein